MSLKIITKIATKPKYLTTYNTGLIQAKAFRILKDRTTLFLKKYDLTTLDWATLGILMNSNQACKPKEIAEELGVEKPYVTVLMTKLIKLSLIKEKENENDKRSKLVELAPGAVDTIKKIESELKIEMKKTISGVSMRDIVGYITTLEAIIANEKKGY